MVGGEHDRVRRVDRGALGPLPGGEPRGDLVEPRERAGRAQHRRGALGDRGVARASSGSGRSVSREASRLIIGSSRVGQRGRQSHGAAGDHQGDGARPRPRRSRSPGRAVAVAAREGVARHDAGADLVGDDDRRSRRGWRTPWRPPRPRERPRRRQRSSPSRFETHSVRQSTIDRRALARSARSRRADRAAPRPRSRSAGRSRAVARDPRGHLVVERLGRRDHGDAAARSARRAPPRCATCRSRRRRAAASCAISSRSLRAPRRRRRTRASRSRSRSPCRRSRDELGGGIAAGQHDRDVRRARSRSAAARPRRGIQPQVIG